jgi:hypothetical protein
MNTYCALLIALLVTLPIGGFVIMGILALLGRYFKIAPGTPWLFFWVGWIERIIFFYATYREAWAVLAGWFVLKGLARFSGGEKEDVDVNRFYLFLAGCGLSLIFGVGGAVLFQKLTGR